MISRGWLRTRTTLRADISAVRAVNYSGILNCSGSSGLFRMVELEVAGKDVEILALVGRPTKVERLADQLRVALGLETNCRAGAYIAFTGKSRCNWYQRDRLVVRYRSADSAMCGKPGQQTGGGVTHVDARAHA